MSLKKGQIYEGYVSDYKFPNMGKIALDDDIVYVKDAIPGQYISFSISKKRSGASEGKLLNVIKRSQIEGAEPSCGNFGECGGCSYQRLSYEDQLKLKSDTVEKILKKIYPEHDFQGIIPSPDTYAYRNKMEYAFGDEYKGGPLALGLHKKNSFYDIINTDTCSIVNSDFNIIRSHTRDFFSDLYSNEKIDFNHHVDHRGYLRHLLIRRSKSKKELLVALITTTADKSDKLTIENERTVIDAFEQSLLSLNASEKLDGNIVGICHVYNNAVSDIVRCDKMDILYGRDYIYEDILGLKFKISLFSFFQTNPSGCEKLYEKVREFASSDGKGVVYDLYSGTGTIAQLLSPAAHSVYGVEIVEDAVRSAKENADLNNIDNVTFIAGDVLKALTDRESYGLPSPDMIILDPPREGIHPRALGLILRFGVEKIIYISCKPTSLARDLQSFKEAGYVLEESLCVDMFPHTVHVETVCLLVRGNSLHIDIDVDVEEML